MHYPRNSYWHESAAQIKNKIKTDKNNIKNKKYDILIIGGGITGLTTAYLLRNTGYKIGIIEGSNIGYGTTGYTTAKLTVQHSILYDYLIKNFSIDKAKQYLRANEEGLNLIKEIIVSNNIECDFKEQIAYVYATTEDEIKTLKTELEAYKKLSIDGFYTDDINLPNKSLGALGIKNQGQFNPLKYLYSIYNVLLENNFIDIYENVRALNIEPHSSEHTVNTDCGDVHAKKLIVTSHYPFDNDFGLFFLRLYQEKSYVIIAKTNSEPFDGMYINVNDPIYSMRYQYTDKDALLILGGGNHQIGRAHV